MSKHGRSYRATSEEALLSSIAMTIGEPARTRILLSLLDGRMRTSTELAALAEVNASTASAHLNRLRETNLICVSAQGRHRYYSLQNAHVARVLESLGVLAGGTTKAFVPGTPESMRKARTCYDHMAGTIAVAFHDHFVREGWLVYDRGGERNAYKMSPVGMTSFSRLGITAAEIRGRRRRFAYGCLDWSERRHHIAGALGAALLQHAIVEKWVVRELNSRTLCLTKFGERDIFRTLGLKL